MSIIRLSDPHPGRCQNMRGGRRCLDYDFVEHVCSFDPPGPITFTGSGSITYTTVDPQPWIKP